MVDDPPAEAPGRRGATIWVAAEAMSRLDGLGLTRVLEDRGHRVRAVASTSWRTLELEDADLLVLVPTPGDDGVVANVARLRRVGLGTGIIVFGDRLPDTLGERLLEAGTDLLLDSSESPRRSAIKLEALARRVRSDWVAVQNYGGLDAQIDIVARSIRVGSASAELSATDFRLLLYLLEHFEHWVSASRIIRHVLGTHHAPGTSVVRVHICSLRKALEPVALRIEHRRAVGYRVTARPRSRVTLTKA